MINYFEFFTAMYDPINDRISGCTEGNVFWWHEAGHRDYLKKGYSSRAGMYMVFALWMAVGLAIKGDKTWAMISLLISVSTLFCEEIYAWLYAFAIIKRSEVAILASVVR